ncbi:hypothetical protein M2459_002709 [Parabacteroides sp. PF5-5]|uniref:STM4504/CBY_0614 family protein n=1 Tax=unclassified Parabacteroides TaxID=2649774 RepID=UPI0024740147|nr:MULTISPECIES: hypothetical protein [unclassified Parabacteroides]MDH6305922.1 hypothetical protein [Parabacteroides sp. PH5-39]MDH6316863.1 hypothetical protein [Parabacteroides sp. PF5-13]MDH6320634.1 hypothetical protein [Parabacteroides sp. PH5-13]MDH6324445.1 hypothetical protein [Parabacteroides sp. PH5-8]MDH6328048.1 hypothetical protein [Parabacteroides sp. PH5-41]
MAIYDIFSKRQKKERGEVPDIYKYDEVSNELRIQIIHIVKEVIGDSYKVSLPDKIYERTAQILRKEYGLFYLDDSSSPKYEVMNFLLKTEVERALDVIELLFRFINNLNKIQEYDEYHYKKNANVNQTPKEAIEELNERFKEHGVGYQFENNKIIRLDSTYIHSEIVKPTIKLLQNPKFKGANDEYMKAHEHYKKGLNKECLTECLKAFESTMKIICSEKGWTYNPTDTAKALITTCFTNQLIPTFMQNQFTSLKSLLESGIPTIRNKLGGHGQGAIPQTVDDKTTRYALNLTGSNIIYLIELSGL